jgi:IclR family transcriptional regulator, pca regulon regulatory protein
MVQVVDRVGAILGAFTSERPVITLSECADASHLSRSSTHRLLLSLETVGLVERQDGGWRLGGLVVRLADIRLGHADVRRDALPQLRKIGQEFRAAMALSVPDGSDMVYVERIESPDAYGPSARLGARAPIWAGGSGRAVLSKLPVAERKARLASDEFARLPSADRELVEREVEAAVERGYALDRGHFFEGIAGIAVAICGRNSYPIAAISVIISPDRLTPATERQVAEALLNLAKELET